MNIIIMECMVTKLMLNTQKSNAKHYIILQDLSAKIKISTKMSINLCFRIERCFDVLV